MTIPLTPRTGACRQAIRKARDDGARISSELFRKVSTDSMSMVEEAILRVRNEKERALIELRTEIVDLATNELNIAIDNAVSVIEGVMEEVDGSELNAGLYAMQIADPSYCGEKILLRHAEVLANRVGL